MRLYVPMREKGIEEEKGTSSLKIPLWVSLFVIALCMIAVMALR
jgi:hypothetical protein